MPASAPTPRPYQVEQISCVQSALQQHRSCMVVAATGTGKTVLMAELARLVTTGGLHAMAGIPGKILVIVERDTLVRQTVAKCEAIGLHADVEKASQRASTTSKVVVASVQTMRGARLQRWRRDHFAVVLVDECHHAAAKSYRTLLGHFCDARIVGVTATPDRGDGKALDEVFDRVESAGGRYGGAAHRYDIRQAIAEGYLVPIIGRRVVVESLDLSEVKMRAGDFASDQLAKAMSQSDTLQGQAVPLLELARDRLTIAYCVDIAHAHALAGALNHLRPGCARAVSGQDDDRDRAELLGAHQRGEFQILCNCDLLVEGYDCPEVSCVAIVRPTRSRGRFVQCAGRGLRLAPWAGKVDCLVLVFGDGKTPGLIGPADCLAGKGEVTDELRDELDRLLGSAQMEIGAALAAAGDNVAGREESRRTAAVARWRADAIDPFVGAPDPQRHWPGWTTEPASQRQREALEEAGITMAKLPDLTRAEAYDLLVRLHERTKAGLCSYKQARKLAGCGVETTHLTFRRARQLMELLAAGGWRPAALRGQPEVTARFDADEWASTAAAGTR